jgi:hypothetical protein
MKTSILDTQITAPNDGAMRTRIVRKLLEGLKSPLKVADLGAGPCIFSKIARDAGHRVTAFDARTVRRPSLEELGSIEFVEADVRNVDLQNFNVILFLGLLYHLEIEDQEKLLKRCNHACVILDCQVHVPALVQNPNPEEWQKKLITERGYSGIRFIEGDNPMASVGNKTSFWHTESSMQRLFENAGFNHLYVIDPIFTSKYGGRRFYMAI